MKKCILEVAVDSVESALSAYNAGADRIELCGNLVIGGTTPSVGLFRTITKYTPIPANILIRPRFGDFLYSDYEYEIIKKEVALFRDEGANGVVIGCLTPEGALDLERMKELIHIAEDMQVVMHRCFDLTKDPFETLRQAEVLGISAILTSGQQSTALEGANLLGELQATTDKVAIMAGSGVNLGVVKRLKEEENLYTFHLSGKKTINSKMTYRKEGVPMGLPIMSEYEIWQTDESIIKEIRNYLDS